MWFSDVTIMPLVRALLACTHGRVGVDIVRMQKDQLASLFDV